MEQSETAEKLVKLLKKKNLTVTTAESCTGGMIASAIVSVAGASACFKEGYITYSNEAKKKLLGVREDTLKQYTVVSATCALTTVYCFKVYGCQRTGSAGNGGRSCGSGTEQSCSFGYGSCGTRPG